METEPENFWQFLFVPEAGFNPVSFEMLIACLLLIILLVSCFLVSSFEMIFSSTKSSGLKKIYEKGTKYNRLMLKLIEIPEYLYSTLLVAVNLIYISSVILSYYILSSLFNFSSDPVFGFFIKTLIIVILLLLFSEVLPKIYLRNSSYGFMRYLACPLVISEKIFRPVNILLINITSSVQRKFTKKSKNISISELSNALELSDYSASEEKNLLRGIVKFGNIYVREIMTSRVDVVAVELNTDFKKLIEVIIESGYSRIPVYENNFDVIKGILYIKDMIPYLKKQSNFNWQRLIRPPYFVPETKKIDDLLKEFQKNKIHLAVAVDEYGGSSGIITLEDILEEIVGEITDETDIDEKIYTQIDANTFVFEGKTNLNDFYKILNVDEKIFDDVKGDADTLAGLILEIRGEIPGKNDKVKYGIFEFKIISADIRRIKKIQVTIKKTDSK